MAFKAEVIADSSGKWSGNGLVFETEAEASAYVDDLAYRWTAVTQTRVVRSDLAPNYRFVDGRLDAR